MDKAVTIYERILARATPTPVVLACREAVARKDWVGLARVSVDPRSYSDSLSYFNDAQAVAFLKKYQGFKNPEAANACVKKWFECESACKSTNLRLQRYLEADPYLPTRADLEIFEFFRSVRRLIGSWIGWSPPLGVEGRFGPGSTVAVRGENVTVLEKIRSRPTMTRAADPCLQDWQWTFWGKTSRTMHGEPLLVRGNRFSTVPKTVLTDRPIGIEPDLNVYYQLGYGQVLRRRLKNNTGWDLEKAQEIHREVARTSSADRAYNTYDLSSASDTVSKVLVKLCLPHYWYEALNSLRSPFTQVEGKWVMLEKFSSMGNGYTFELETILFAAILQTALRRAGLEVKLGAGVFVFGDDIIVPNREGVDELVTRCLTFCGFSLNMEKSFTGSVPFRESCGGDYFNGEAVRPYYQKRSLHGPTEVFACLNGLRRSNAALEALGGSPSWAAWNHALNLLPVNLRRFRGPHDLGDAVIWDDDPSRWISKREFDIRYIKCLVPKPTRLAWYDHYVPDVTLAAALYGTGNSNLGGLPLRGFVQYRPAWVPYS